VKRTSLSLFLFAALKLIGAFYLIWLGVRTFREASRRPPEETATPKNGRAFRDGVLVEALNPKTAAFFLAFIPQFIDPTAGYPALQFIALGLASVTLNTSADIVAALMASRASTGLARRPHLLQRIRQGSGIFIAGLGLSLALARRPAS